LGQFSSEDVDGWDKPGHDKVMLRADSGYAAFL
jgi:hypothetical protein